MTNAELIYPREEYLQSYLSFCREMKDKGVDTYKSKGPDTFGEWGPTFCADCEDWRHGRNLPEGYVPYTNFWLVDEGEVVGTCNIRHVLNEFLSNYSGHIGYGVRPSRWRQGYGELQLALLLPEAKKIGLDRVLITCNDDNPGSARIIEKNGGVLDSIFEMDDNGIHRKRRRYWVETT